MKEDLSRREFLKKAAVVAGATSATAVGLGGCMSSAAENANKTAVWMPDTWDYEADTVIMGYGGAGASAAIQAARKGATAIILEKAPEKFFGGNTSVSGGGMLGVTDREKAKTFFRAQFGKNVSEAELDAFVDTNMHLQDFLKSLSPDYKMNVVEPPVGARGALYPNLKGADGIGRMYSFGGGDKLFAALKKTIDDNYTKLVTVMAETPATRLIFHPVTKEVYGVYAESKGKQIAVRAKKAVIMACGGFENNESMMATFCEAGGNKIWPWGNPYNTGDGIKMITEIGAELRHFVPLELAPPACVKASQDAGVAITQSLQATGMNHAIFVNKYGKRFFNELNTGDASVCPLPTHSKENIPMFDYDIKKYEFPNLPYYIVFDEVKRAAGPLCDAATKGSMSWAGRKETFTWSKDNLTEIEKGYILKADTLKELAEKAGIDADGLVASVKKWNDMCAAGKDTEFGRTLQLAPIDTAPYYLSEMGMSIINTQGGPARNENCQVMSWEKKPIPRLYAAGEFGSIFGFLYAGALNLPECVSSGVHAAEFALSNETVWE